MKRVCLLSACFLLALTAAMAQTGVDGSILGVVTDANGGSVAGATVTVTGGAAVILRLTVELVVPPRPEFVTLMGTLVPT